MSDDEKPRSHGSYSPAPPPPPFPAPFTYTPSMTPVHPPPSASTQPTYITNHFHPPEPVEVDQEEHQPIDELEWLPATTHDADALSYVAVVAGHEPSGDPLWVIRADYAGEIIPGKLAVKERRAYIPYDCREIPVHKFEVLCDPGQNTCWLGSSRGEVPESAIPGGHTQTGEILYIGRAKHKRSLTPGKIHPSHRRLYISFDGGEEKFKHYEVLCKRTGGRYSSTTSTSSCDSSSRDKKWTLPSW